MLHGPVLDAVRAVVGLALVAFLPGYLWTRLIWDDLAVASRVLFSIVVSLATVTVSVWSLNFFLAMPITVSTALLVVLFLSALPGGLLLRPRIREALAEMEAGDGPGHQP